MLSENDIYEKLIFPFIAGKTNYNNIRSRTGTTTLYGKKYFLKTSKIDLTHEAEMLKVANNIKSELPVRAVTFVYYCSNNNILITEFFSGESLFNKLWNNTSLIKFSKHPPIYQDWGVLFTNIFKWLSLFHASSINKYYTVDQSMAIKNNVIEDLKKKTNAIHKLSNSILKRKEWEKLNSIICRGEELSWQDLPTADIHGDLTISNMLVNANDVFILDFADTTKGFVLEDIVRLWSGIWEVSECGYKRGQILRPHLNHFLTSYGCNHNIVSTIPFLLLRTRNAMIRLHESLLITDKLSWSTRKILNKLAKKELKFLKDHVFSKI